MLASGTVIEIDRFLDGNGGTGLARHRLKVGPELVGKMVTLRLNGHLIHVVYNGVLTTLPSPLLANHRHGLRSPDRHHPTTLPARPKHDL